MTIQSHAAILTARLTAMALLGATLVATPASAAGNSFSWSGIYVGVNFGYGWANQTATFTPIDASLASSIGGPPISFSTGGAVGGVQLGYNWQFAPNWVAGLEADFDFAGLSRRGNTTFQSAGLRFTSTADESTEWFGTVRARLGFLPTPNLLVYGTGGLAYGRVVQNSSLTNLSGASLASGPSLCAPGVCAAGTSSRIATGWSAGGGAEYAFALNNWSLRADYLYVNLGHNSFRESFSFPGSTSGYTVSFKDTAFHVGRIGLNYRF